MELGNLISTLNHWVKCKGFTFFSQTDLGKSAGELHLVTNFVPL